MVPSSGRKRARGREEGPESGATPAKSPRPPPTAGSRESPNVASPLPEQDRHTCVIFIIEKKISSGHLSHLKGVAKKKGFPLTDSISDAVTHVVSALTSHERAVAALSSQLPPQAEVVSLEWLTNSFLEGKPVQVTDRYRLKKPPPLDRTDDVGTPKRDSQRIYELPDYECQRPTLLNHHNHTLTDALELLERYHQHLDYKEGDTRALAFRQASCTLKALPKKVEHIDEVSHLPRIGRHSKQVIREILSNGFSTEIEECKSSEWFQCMELFTSVYGCGPATAEKWYHKGLRTIQDVQQCKDVELTEIQKLGLKYYEHISVPVSRKETEFITAYIQTQAEVCFPGTTVEAVGGFRRGKSHGHDVDLLLTHPDPNATNTLLETLLDHLHKQGAIVHADMTSGQNTLSQVQHAHVNTSRHNFTPDGKQRRVKFDHLDKAFCILKFDAGGMEQEEGEKASNSPLIRRVDLIVVPPEQYPFALVSWTGSKQFNRSLRRYSVKECSMSVTAHGIYDISQGKFIPAKTEKDVFAILKLKYLEPWERNC